MPRPLGVTAIAIIFAGAAAYLFVIGLTLLLKPGTFSLMLGSPLLGGLELAGPFMFLLFSAVGITISLGLLRMNNWARRVAAIAALFGIVLLLPTVSAAATGDRPWALVSSGLGIILRVVIVWYLYQEPVTDAFLGSRSINLSPPD